MTHAFRAAVVLALVTSFGGWTAAAAHAVAASPADTWQATVLSTARGIAAIEQARLTPPAGGTIHDFGSAVAVAGDTALIGAPYEDVGAVANQGAVYVFVRSGTTWTLRARLTAADGHSGDTFGAAIALEGDTAIIGAPRDNQLLAADCGCAYVFTHSGGVWTQRARLIDQEVAAGDHFGASVAIAGDIAAVGAPERDGDGGVDQGRACICVGTGGSWEVRQALTAPGGAAGDWFGNSVAVSGDTVLVGAQGDDVDGWNNQGSAHVYVRSGLFWDHEARLVAPGGDALDGFGSAVALSGETALVGAPGTRVHANNRQGSVHVFLRAGGRWTQPAELLAPDGAADDFFGFSLALDDGVAVAGALDAHRGDKTGAAYVFAGAGRQWSWLATLTASDGAVTDSFGESAAISGETAFVGDPMHTVDGIVERGAAYAFLLDGPPATTAAVGPAPNRAGWNRTPVTVTLTAADWASGVAYTEYRRQGAPQWTTYSGPLAVEAAGETTWEYRSADRAGAVEAAKTIVVRIGTTRPATRAFPAAARRGKNVRLRFKVAERLPGCDKATVTLKIFKNGRLKRTLKPGLRPCNVKLSYRWRCTLAPGRYRLKVYATDLAGNHQRKVGSAPLLVR